MNDHKDVALVFDMRSSAKFNHCQLAKSINFPIEQMTDDIFMQWPQKVKAIELDKSILKSKYSSFAFKYRKRHWVFIIGAHSSQNLNETILEIAAFGDKAKME